MIYLLTQPQKELQLNLKTNNTQNGKKKIQVYGSPTTKDLKEATSIQTGRRDRDTEMEQRSEEMWYGAERPQWWKMGKGGPTIT